MNSSCRLLSNGYKFQVRDDNQLHLMPCCMWRGQTHKVNNREEAIKYRQFLNSLDANVVSACADCIYQEDKNLRKSWRESSYDIVPKDSIPGDLTYLELQLDTVCNSGCIICGPWHSTYWQQELTKKVIPIQSNTHLDTIINLAGEQLQKIRRILFLGGETLLSDTDSKLLPLIERPELVDLQYTINASIYPTQDRIDLWKKFKSVQINLSIDGIAERFEYIRYPLNWDKVNNNICCMLQEMPNNVFFHIIHTVNIFNLYYYNEIEEWHRNTFTINRNGKPMFLIFNPASGILSPNRVTPALLKLISTKYNSDSKVVKVIENASLDSTALLQYISEIDQRRNLNWRDVFPEIKDCF